MANPMTTTAPQPMNGLNNLWWVVTAALILFGVFVFSESWIAGLMLIIFSGLVSPSGFARILAWLRASDPLQCRVVVVLIALVSSTYVLYEHSASIEADAAEVTRIQALADAQEAQAKEEAEAAAQLNEAKTYYAAHREGVLADFAAAVDGKNLATATVIRNRFVLAVQDPDFDQILNRYAELKEESARAEAEKARKAKVAELSGKLSSVGATDYAQAITIYTELVALEPANKTYQQKLERYTKARDAQVAKEAAKLAADLAKAEHQKKLEAQFSGYDGSHYKFERMIKQAMNDPDSYDHVETKYIDKGSYIRVFCTFRGKNAFGGTVKNTKVADFTIDGSFLKEVQ